VGAKRVEARDLRGARSLRQVEFLDIEQRGLLNRISLFRDLARFKRSLNSSTVRGFSNSRCSKRRLVYLPTRIVGPGISGH